MPLAGLGLIRVIPSREGLDLLNNLIRYDILFDANKVEFSMRTTVSIDDALYQKALELADINMEKAAIF